FEYGISSVSGQYQPDVAVLSFIHLRSNSRDRLLLLQCLPHGIGWGTPDTKVGKPSLPHHLRIIKIAAIDNDGIAKNLVELIEIKRGEFPPIGQDKQGIRIFCCLVSALGISKGGATG